MVGCEGSDGRITLYLNNISTGAFISGTLRVCGVNYTVPTSGYTLWYRADSGEFFAPPIEGLKFSFWTDEYGKERVENPMTQRLHPGVATFTVASYEVPPVPPVRKPAWGLVGVLGFVAAVMGVAYLSDRTARRISTTSLGDESCPGDEETVRIYLRRLSDAFGTEQPLYTFKANEVCPPQYAACITYPEPLHFKCGHVQPVVVIHEYGHWLLKKKASPYYDDEVVVEAFADLFLKLLSGKNKFGRL